MRFGVGACERSGKGREVKQIISAARVHRFRFLDGWQMADGAKGGEGTKLALSGVMSATFGWSLRVGCETGTLCWDVACVPSGWVDLNVSS